MQGTKAQAFSLISFVIVVVNRCEKLLDFGVKTLELLKISMNLWPPESCPKCIEGGIPLDLSSPDTKLDLILESLPEESRPVLEIAIGEILEELKEGKPFEELLKISRPIHEFPGEKPPGEKV